MNRHALSNEQWARLAPLLPPQKPKTGRPALDHRLIIDGILWILRTGAPWRDLPERYGSWHTVSSRFYRWRKAGIWDRILAELQRQADAAGELDWQEHFVDGTVIRAHQHAAGAKKGLHQRTRHRATRPWVGPKGASAPKSTYASRGRASRSPSS
jgi:transposase